MAVEIKMSDGTVLVYDGPDGMDGLKVTFDQGRQFVAVDDQKTRTTYLLNPQQVISLRTIT